METANRDNSHIKCVQHYSQYFDMLETVDDYVISHRLNDEYITVVIVPGSLLRSTKEFKLGYFMGFPGSRLNFTVIRNSSRKILLVI